MRPGPERPLKRGRAGPAEPAARTPQGELTEALALSTDLPERCRMMLAAMLPSSVLIPRDQRHEHQEKVVGMLEEVLRGIEAGFVERLSDAEGVLQSLAGEKATRDAAREAAEAELNAKAQVSEERRVAKKEATTGRVEAVAALAAARVAREEADAEAEGAAAKKARCQEVAQGDLPKLKQDACEDAMKARQLASFAREMRFDESLVDGFPAAVLKGPNERGTFDSMLLQQFEAQLKKTIASLDACTANRSKTDAEHAAKIKAAESAVESAQAREQQATEALTAAKAEVAEFSATDRAAKKHVRDFAPQLRSAEATKAAASGELEDFRGGTLATFEALRDREAHPPVALHSEAPGEAEAPAGPAERAP